MHRLFEKPRRMDALLSSNMCDSKQQTKKKEKNSHQRRKKKPDAQLQRQMEAPSEREEARGNEANSSVEMTDE